MPFRRTKRLSMHTESTRVFWSPSTFNLQLQHHFPVSARPHIDRLRPLRSKELVSPTKWTNKTRMSVCITPSAENTPHEMMPPSPYNSTDRWSYSSILQRHLTCTPLCSDHLLRISHRLLLRSGVRISLSSHFSILRTSRHVSVISNPLVSSFHHLFSRNNALRSLCDIAA